MVVQSLYYIIIMQHGDCTTIGKLSITRESHISDIDSSKCGVVMEVYSLHTQKGSPVVHTPYNVLYIRSTVGRSIAYIISDLGEHI